MGSLFLPLCQLFNPSNFLLVSQVKTDFNMSGAHSGVAIREEVLEAFQELKIGHKHRFVLFKMTDNMEEVVVDAQGGAGDSCDQFVSSLPQDDCRYAIYDFEYNQGEGQRNKILLVVWAPDSARIKSKMLYASTKDALKKKLVGIGTEIQATDLSEIDYQTVFDKVVRI